MSTAITKIRAQSVLSFGPKAEWIELHDLNVLIGPNGAGKSNLLEVLSLLRSAPTSDGVFRPIIEGGGVQEWRYKNGNSNPPSAIDVIIPYVKGPQPLHYRIELFDGDTLDIADEFVQEAERRFSSEEDVYFFYRYQHGNPWISTWDRADIGTIHNQIGLREDDPPRRKRNLKHEEIDASKSVLYQKVDEYYYPEITFVGRLFEEVKIYRDWSFGSKHSARSPQATTLPAAFLQESADNLAVVLNSLKLRAGDKIRRGLEGLIEGAVDIHMDLVGGDVQLFLREGPGDRHISAKRLSDGTIRFLCLLAILCHPKPPRLVCIEEPELGLHPDVILQLPELLQDAATRTQLIVTTHSGDLVSAFTSDPEAVCVTEKTISGTSIRRLSKIELAPWLEKYRLGELWEMGEIGGNRL